MKNLLIMAFIFVVSTTAQSSIYRFDPEGDIPSFNNGAGIGFKAFIDGIELDPRQGILNPN